MTFTKHITTIEPALMSFIAAMLNSVETKDLRVVRMAVNSHIKGTEGVRAAMHRIK